MPEQSKFENVDLFASLEAIMKQNTGFYQSDLDIDKEIIAKAAAVCQKADAGTDKGRIYCKTDDSEKRREEFCETDGGGSGERK